MLKIALRNVIRNARRTSATTLTIATGAVAMLAFGGFMLFSTYGLQTATVRANGHLAIYRNGYFLYGAGNPAAWGIVGYARLIRLVKSDPELSGLIEVVTPVQAISGIIANPTADTSKTFFGTGFVPSERDRMRAWNPYGAAPPNGTRSGLVDDMPNEGLIGNGLALILGLCEQLHLADCPRPVEAPDAAAPDKPIAPDENFSHLTDPGTGEVFEAISAAPKVQLLGATVGGHRTSCSSNSSAANIRA